MSFQTRQWRQWVHERFAWDHDVYNFVFTCCSKRMRNCRRSWKKSDNRLQRKRLTLTNTYRKWAVVLTIILNNTLWYWFPHFRHTIFGHTIISALTVFFVWPVVAEAALCTDRLLCVNGMTCPFLSERNPLWTAANLTSGHFFFQNNRPARFSTLMLLSSIALSPCSLWYLSRM